MKIFLIVVGILAALILLLILMKLRRKRKKFFQTGLKHPTGYLKYHSQTETKVKAAFQSQPKSSEEKKAVAYLKFKGDLRASERHVLSHLIDEIILNKEKFSEVVVIVESPGGSVAEYGHVYAEMCRVPQAGLSLTVCVDAVAASGGYLMSLPAQKILAAPFATVGSIGVVSFVPNIRKLLEKFYIEPRTFTAGDYKRTVTLTDSATPEQIERYKEQLNLIHEQFKFALKKHRPQVDLATVATGEAWLAATTIERDLKLVDGLRASADYLLELNREKDLVEFSESIRKKAWSKFLDFFTAASSQI